MRCFESLSPRPGLSHCPSLFHALVCLGLNLGTSLVGLALAPIRLELLLELYLVLLSLAFGSQLRLLVTPFGFALLQLTLSLELRVHLETLGAF